MILIALHMIFSSNMTMPFDDRITRRYPAVVLGRSWDLEMTQNRALSDM